jgi:hypothetical protein
MWSGRLVASMRARWSAVVVSAALCTLDSPAFGQSIAMLRGRVTDP